MQTEAHEVHADQRRGCGTRIQRRVDRLVPDRHAGLVDAVLGSPAPRRSRDQTADRLGVARCQLDVSPGIGDVSRWRRIPLDHLLLVGWAVAVLGEQRERLAGGRWKGDEAIAHQLND